MKMKKTFSLKLMLLGLLIGFGSMTAFAGDFFTNGGFVFEKVPGTDIAAITFKTAAERLYHVLVSDSVDGATGWSPVATADSVDGEFGYGTYEGTGRKLTVYVDASLETAFFKVACH